MASLDFEAEKSAFRAYYDSNSALLKDAKASFLTLIRSLLVGSEHSSAVTSGDEVEPIGHLVRDQFEVLGVTDKIAEIEGTENAFGYKGEVAP